MADASLKRATLSLKRVRSNQRIICQILCFKPKTFYFNSVVKLKTRDIHVVSRAHDLNTNNKTATNNREF